MSANAAYSRYLDSHYFNYDFLGQGFFTDVYHELGAGVYHEPLDDPWDSYLTSYADFDAEGYL